MEYGSVHTFDAMSLRWLALMTYDRKSEMSLLRAVMRLCAFEEFDAASSALVHNVENAEPKLEAKECTRYFAAQTAEAISLMSDALTLAVTAPIFEARSEYWLSVAASILLRKSES